MFWSFFRSSRQKSIIKNALLIQTYLIKNEEENDD